MKTMYHVAKLVMATTGAEMMVHAKAIERNTSTWPAGYSLEGALSRQGIPTAKGRTRKLTAKERAFVLDCVALVKKHQQQDARALWDFMNPGQEPTSDLSSLVQLVR